MCLLCYYPPQAETNLSGLENSCLNNPDGFGWSALNSESGILSTFHSMNADETISKFAKFREQNPDTHALFHARFATAGTVTVDNCHPYQIGGGLNAVLGHNGHLSGVQIPKGDKRSDTRVFAEDLLPQRVSALDIPKRLRKLEKWASGSKFVILNADQRLKESVYIVNEGLGHWSDGVWYSNSDYLLDYRWGSYRYGLGQFPHGFAASEYISDDPEFDNCPECRSVLDNNWVYEFGTCKACRFCLDCYEIPRDCLCYSYNLKGAY